MQMILTLKEKFWTLKFFLLLSVFFIGWNITLNKFNVTYSNAFPDAGTQPTQSLAAIMDSKFYLDRTCVQASSLEDRKRVRWVIFKIEHALYAESFKWGGYYLEKTAYAVFHTLFIFFAAFFSIKSVLQLLSRVSSKFSAQQREDWAYLFAVPVFCVFSLFIFNGRVSEFSFSIIEAFCIAAGLYFSLKKQVFPFTLVLLTAVLNRESGFIILGIWFAFNGFKQLLIPLLSSVLVFFLVNIDIARCLVQPSFFVPEGQTALAGVSTSSIAMINSICSHYFFFFLILLVLWRGLAQLAPKSLAVDNNKLFYLSMFYLLVFIVATPVQHTSIKYLLVPFMTVMATIYLFLRVEQSCKA